MSTEDEQVAYEIISKRGSASMGAYRGKTPAEALAKQVRDAGYSAEVVDERRATARRRRVSGGSADQARPRIGRGCPARGVTPAA